MEMRRLYEAGEIGEVTYAEGEYNHPMPSEMFMDLSPGPDHWRKWIPSTYYCTHGLAPLMCITGRMPIKVNALSIACREPNELMVRQGDPGSVILCRMDNGSVFRLFGLFLPGHSIEYRVHGSGGAMETVRGTGQLRVWHEEWNCPEGSPTHRSYMPEWPSNAQMASVAGHGGGDFWTSFEFAKAIRTGEQPFLDVYRGVAMSSVGVLAWKSALADGAPFDMPDFRCEEARQAYVDDAWSPFPSHSGPGQPPPSIRGPLLK
jgi:predicted dehydrogenase